MMRTALAAWVVAATVRSTSGTLEHSYNQSEFVLGGDLEIQWTTVDDSDLCVALIAKSSAVLDANGQGWVGLGIAEQTSGSMGGADILVVQFSDDGAQATARDMYATGFSTPLDDCVNDWEIKTVEADTSAGTVSAEACRPLVVEDTNNRDIDNSFVDPNFRTIAALGKGGFSKHAPGNAQSFSIPLLSFSPLPDKFQRLRESDAVFTVEIRHGNAKSALDTFSQKVKDNNADGTLIGSRKTQYVDYVWDVSDFLDFNATQLKYHIVGFEPIIEPATKPYVHHYVLNLDNTAQAIFPWASGGTGFVLPEQVGFPLDSGNTLHLNTHFDNPTGNPISTRDNGGVRLYLVAVPRPMEAGLVQIGDPQVALAFSEEYANLPAGDSRLTIGCPSSCFKEELTVISVMHHMHAKGVQFRTVHRNAAGEDVTDPVMAGAEYYDWSFQPTIPANFKINKGDSFTTECTFRTNGNIQFGLGSENEMCMSFIMVYPKPPNILYCGLESNARDCRTSNVFKFERSAVNRLWPPPQTSPELSNLCASPTDPPPNSAASSLASSLAAFLLVFSLFV